jgi:hypothetical protein
MYIYLTNVNLVTPKAGAEHGLLFNELAVEARGGFIEQKHVLNSYFKCDQIYK